MYTKAEIFNLALGALLLSRRIIDTETETNNEVIVLRTHYDVAFRSSLQDMDLDSTSSQAVLSLIEVKPNNLWQYSYRYPSECVFLRRIQSNQIADQRYTRIPLRVSIKSSLKCIFTNQENAIAEYISKDVPLSSLSPNAGLAIAYKLAMLSAPLVSGKGARELIKQIQSNYVLAKTDAQEQDRNENFIFTAPEDESEFVAERLS